MKRLGIFCFYDTDGIVDAYVEFLIKNLKEVLTKLIVVVNGNINAEGRDAFQKYADEMVVRENIGYDFGAYREVIIRMYEEGKVTAWDEIVFCNDTFYGPFVSFNKMFSYMEQTDADFWGINLLENGFFTHIQSYFLVFRENIVKDKVLYQYMREQEVSEYLQESNLADIYAFFEVGLFHYLVVQGYKYAAYTNTERHDVYAYPDLCIKKYNLPILKKKCFSGEYYQKQKFDEMLMCISEGYDCSMIIQNAKRNYKYDQIVNANIDEEEHVYYPEPIAEEDILKFVQYYPEAYIYGTGVYARKVWLLFHKHIKDFKGFIISDNQRKREDTLYGYPVSYYADVASGSAIIIGCDFGNTKEIMCKIKKEDHVCVIWDKLKNNEVNVE